MRLTLVVIAIALAAALAGCTDGAVVSVPTLTLIPPTTTPTPTLAAPTVTRQPLTSPQDLAATRAVPTPTQAEDEASLLDIDPVAAELAALAQRLLAEQLDLPVRRVRLVHVQAVIWPDTSLGCPQLDQIYAQMLVNGYRIVVEAAGEQVIFHTDFDRALQCPAEAEVLPPGVVPLAEATAES